FHYTCLISLHFRTTHLLPDAVHSPVILHSSLLYIAPAPSDTYTLSLHDALPICGGFRRYSTVGYAPSSRGAGLGRRQPVTGDRRSEEHTSELQSRFDLVCRLLLEKKKAEGNTRENSIISVNNEVTSKDT